MKVNIKSNTIDRANKGLYNKVTKVLDKNKSERHLRGGQATKEKYSHIRKNNKSA